MVHARRGGSHFPPQKRLRMPAPKAARQMAHSRTSANAQKTWTRDTDAPTRAQAEVHTGTVALATDSEKADTLRCASTWRMETGEPEEPTGTATSIFFWFPNSISRPPLLPQHARTHTGVTRWKEVATRVNRGRHAPELDRQRQWFCHGVEHRATRVTGG